MKKFMEALEELQEQEKKQERLHEKHDITDANVIIVEKNNMIKFSVRSIATIVRLLATCVILVLAAVGMLCIIYPETRQPLAGICEQLIGQLRTLLG